MPRAARSGHRENQGVQTHERRRGYWRGDSNREQLTRIYGTAFFDKKDLENHLKLLEEAKKRDHRVIGKQLSLFTISPLVGQRTDALDAQGRGAALSSSKLSFARN